MEEVIRERLRGKTVVIWGIGPLQEDLEAFYPFLNPLFYIDDRFEEREISSALAGRVYSPQKLAEKKIDGEKLIVILCTEAVSAIHRLENMGYGEKMYLLGEDLLMNIPLYRQFCERGFSIWGIGDTYYRREKDIHEYLSDIRNFVVTEKGGNDRGEFQGKEVLSKKELEERGTGAYIVVASIYYKEICEELTELGLKRGKDFAHVDTLILLGKMARIAQTGYNLEDRRKNSRELAVILAGYKEFIWDSVFPRLKEYIPSNLDVCVVTSGLVNSRLEEMCREYGWSYMSVAWNNVSAALNLAIWKHPKAEYIYKLDEDIFVTRGTFETVKATYEEAEQRGRYNVGFATPLIPVNGYGHMRLLEILDKVEEWESRFGRLTWGGDIYRNPQAARFMWELGELEEFGEELRKGDLQYSACPVLYSIGFILFHRKTWVRMGMFPMLKHKNVGSDEDHICGYCVKNGLAILVAENTVVGHLSYGPQNQEMEKYYYEHREKFCMREGEKELSHKTE